MAESEGFEPSERLRAQRFSRPPRSTTPATLPRLPRVEACGLYKEAFLSASPVGSMSQITHSSHDPEYKKRSELPHCVEINAYFRALKLSALL